MHKSISLFRLLILSLAGLLALTGLSSCGGGGGGGGSTTDPETVFQLYPPDWGVNGYTENYNVNGTLKLNSEEKPGRGTYELKIGD
jgi:hypothetical protein